MKRLPVKWITALTFLVSISYVLYRVAAYNNVIIITRNAKWVEVGVEPARNASSSQLSLLVVGDTGKDTDDRTKVVAAMRDHAERSSPDAAILLGDNFYESGVESVDDPRFQSDFENLFDAESFSFPFYVCLGNHDCSGNIDAQVDYTDRSVRWKMPKTYYRKRLDAGTATVDLFVIDSVAIHNNDPSAAEQMTWFNDELAASDATWKIVIGHHPAITGGRHEVSDEIAVVLPPLFEKHGVDLYLSGHDHDLQLNDSGRGWMQVVSGAGSKLRSTNWIDETVYAKAVPGFCWILIDDGELSMSFYSTDERLYTHTIRKSVHESLTRLTAFQRLPVLN